MTVIYATPKCDQALTASVNVSIPHSVTCWKEAKPYLKNLKGTPNGFSKEIQVWKDVASTPHAQKVRQFLNGEEIHIDTNRLCIFVSRAYVKNADDAREIVKKIFEGDYIKITPKIQDSLKIKAKIIPESYKILSQINEEHFFQFKEPIRIRVNFTTSIQLKNAIKDIPSSKLEDGFTIETYDHYVMILKKLLNDPSSIYFAKATPDKDLLARGFSENFSYYSPKPTLFNTPKTVDDLEKIFFHEYFYKHSISLESLCKLANDFGTHRETIGMEEFAVSYASTQMTFGNDYIQGSASFDLDFPTTFNDIQDFYEKLVIAIQNLESAEESLAKIEDPTLSRNVIIGPDGMQLSFFINNQANSAKRTLYSRFYATHVQQMSKNHPNDLLKNFEDLKNNIHKLHGNLKRLEAFFRHEVFAFFAENDAPIRRKELSKFIFFKIAMDPLSYADCGNPYYEKISRMILNL